MSEETLLNVNHIDVFYGSLQILWGVSFEVKQGEIVALIGSNSSGKSTLLNTLSGLLRPSNGGIKFDGENTELMNPFQIVALGISQVPEGRRIFPEMTVLDNLLIGSYNRRARSKREGNLTKVYEHFPILRLRKKQVASTLSGGEQQMLAIGRGLMAEPRLLLLDEMSLGLAPIILDELYRTLMEIRERGITILFVEQNVRRSLKEADRAYIIKSGRIVLSGSAKELQEDDEIKRAYFGV
ncbi:MAG: ABC transporter ATP-binding protein [Deltaproteobacteria bacterium]|nr:ABC transporter ATP-binding protein [Deltaproteobacteria bacterium]